MSTGVILTVLSNIPWGQVVENAPRVAEGASKLWKSVSGFRNKAATSEGSEASSGPRQPTEAEILGARVEELEESVRSLSEQMQVSSELIKELADQNAQLVARIELNRSLLHRVTLAAAVVCTVLGAVVAFLAFRQ